MIVFHALLILCIPALSLILAKRVKLVEWLGAVVVCYIAGIVMANLPWTVSKSLTKPVTEFTIVLALPLLLFSSDMKAWLKLARSAIISFLLMLVAAVSSSLLTYWLLGNTVKDSWKIAGMLVGMYSGGTANTSAIGTALNVDQQVFVMVTSADLIAGGFWLLFIMSLGQRICLLFLPAFPASAPPEQEETPAQEGTRERLLFSHYPKGAQLGIAIGCSLLVVAASMGISLALFQKLDGTTVILSLTTLGLLASLWKPIRSLAWSYEAGDYLLLTFCVAIGAMVDFQKLFGSTTILTFLGFAACLMFGAIVIHMLLAALFRIDADTTLITSAAGIFGPPFIGPIASALKNRAILVSGLTMSIAGLAVGTYLGLLVARLLQP